MTFLEAERDSFAKVMAIWGIERRNARHLLPRLKTYRARAETDEVGFGGNIMVPRVGTHFPGSVRQALDEFLEKWPDAPESTDAPEQSTTTVAPAQQQGPTVPPGKGGCGGCASRTGTGSGWIGALLALGLLLFRRAQPLSS